MILLAATYMLGLSLHGASAQEAGSQFRRGDWLEDFQQLKAGLERAYVNLAWMGSQQSGIDVPRLERRTQDALAQATTDSEAEKALLDFVAGFHDGHLSPLSRLAVPAGAPAPEPEDAALVRGDALTGCAALGYAATSPVAFSLPFESLPGFVMLGDGLSAPFRSGLVPGPDGRRIGIVRIQSFQSTAFPDLCTRAWSALEAADTPLTPRAIEDEASDLWFAALAETLAKLRAQKAVAVLVDVGNNSGGDDSGDWMPRMFTGRTVASAPLWMVDAPVSASYFDEQIRSMNRGLAAKPKADGARALEQARNFFESAKARIGTQRCELAWVWTEQRPWKLEGCNNLLAAGSAGGFLRSAPRSAYGDGKLASRLSWSVAIARHFGAWTGPAYVLADKRSFSAAEMFVATMKDNGIAKVLGARTGGDGCGFMADGDPLVLTHSHLRFRVPNCMRLRADGTNEVAGIAPDFPIVPMQGESARARAARALAVIAGDLPNAR
ncbi:S41 family peptidase [Sphingomonas sp. CJ20]